MRVADGRQNIFTAAPANSFQSVLYTYFHRKEFRRKKGILDFVSLFFFASLNFFNFLPNINIKNIL